MSEADNAACCTHVNYLIVERVKWQNHRATYPPPARNAAIKSAVSKRTVKRRLCQRLRHHDRVRVGVGEAVLHEMGLAVGADRADAEDGVALAVGLARGGDALPLEVEDGPVG